MRLCRECKLYDPLHHKHWDGIDKNSHIRRSKRIYFIFIPYNLLKINKKWGMTEFNEWTVSCHSELFLDLERGGILISKTIKLRSLLEW